MQCTQGLTFPLLHLALNKLLYTGRSGAPPVHFPRRRSEHTHGNSSLPPQTLSLWEASGSLLVSSLASISTFCINWQQPAWLLLTAGHAFPPKDISIPARSCLRSAAHAPAAGGLRDQEELHLPWRADRTAHAAPLSAMGRTLCRNMVTPCMSP